MFHRLKALGLAVIAALAMSAMVTSAAQAQFTASSYPTTVTATSALGNDVIVIDGSTQECVSHFQGTLVEASTSLTLTPSYSSCRSFGFASGAYNMNGCAYVINVSGSFGIECPAGKAIIMTSGNCEVQIPAQSGLSKVTLTNHHPHVDMKFSLSGMTANKTKDGFLCPFAGTGHVSNVTYAQAAAIHVEPKSGGSTLSVD